MDASEARRLLGQADLICDPRQIADAIGRLAGEITMRLADDFPLVLAVMGGATIFAGHLLPQLTFPLNYDYLHASRYGDATSGGDLRWLVEPRTEVRGRVVLLVDDILDEGVTLAAIRARLLREGATRCLTAVLADKQIGRSKPIRADFVGLELPNRYVFGFGMDVRGLWRNLPAIYAMKDGQGD